MAHKQYAHAVIDLETLGQRDDAIILSVGIVKLDLNGVLIPKEEHGELYMALDVHDQLTKGRSVTDSTNRWWLNQSYEARKVFSEEKYSVLVALDYIKRFLYEGKPGPIDPMIWGNGPEFDNRILGNLFEQYGWEIPWSYRQNQSIRMIKGFFPDCIESIRFEGVQHNALDDARHEARLLSNVITNGDLPNPYYRLASDERIIEEMNKLQEQAALAQLQADTYHLRNTVLVTTKP